MTAHIRQAQIADVPEYLAYLRRHTAESGRDGDVIFVPFEEPRDHKLEEFTNEKTKAWFKPVTEVGWARAWILTDEKKIFGEVKLVNSPPMSASLHRALLMIGLERSHRGQGHGQALMNIAIAWAKAQPTLDYIDLNVFENNPRAKKLYQNLGFEEVGWYKDYFRVFGQKIDDTAMTLKLR